MIFNRNKKKTETETETEEQADSTPQPEAEAKDYVAELRAKEKREPIASFLDMKLVELSPGYAKLTMKLSRKYLNFNGLVFGGIIMSLADQAFGYASNSVAHPSVATQFNIHFIATADVNDQLTAECCVVKNGRRAGISEMNVTNQEGKLIARATGTTIPIQPTA